jgi:hypothetical protein
MVMTDDGALRVQIDPDGKFAEAVSDAIKKVDDLRPAFMAIIPSWFKSNRAIFLLKGPGKFEDLTSAYKRQKQRAVGFMYPILRRSGFLEKSITESGDSDSIVRMTKTDMDLGTSIPYAGFVHKRRPFIMIGAEQTGPEEFNVRRQRWIETIENYVLQVAEQSGVGGVK